MIKSQMAETFRNCAWVWGNSSLKLRLLLLTKAKHSNLYLFLLKPPTFCFLFSTFPSPNPLPFYPSPLFSKFHGLLLTPSTNDLFLFPSSLPIPLHLPTRPSKDPAHEEHHRSCRKKHFHKLPSDRLPVLLHQLVQGGAPASWQPSPGELTHSQLLPQAEENNNNDFTRHIFLTALQNVNMCSLVQVFI